MKRYLSALTVFWVMFLQIAYADFDYSGMKESANEKTGFFTINEDQDSNNSYITADIFSISERSFDHKYHSDDYYSNFENDWIIFDYNSEKATPLRRLWIDISSKSALNISSVTFSFNNNVCTFSGFLRPHVDITQYKN